MLVSKFLLIYQIVIETLSRDLFGKLIKKKKKTWTPKFIQIKTPLQTITLIRNPVSEARSLWGLWVLVHTGFFSSPPNISGGRGFDSKRDFVPPTILLGLLLCPQTWGIFFW